MTEQDKQALIEYYCQRDCGHTREECCLDNCHEIMLIEEFPTTPSAQPEIIYCKDCKKHNKHYHESPYKDTVCPLTAWRGKAQGHEYDYQYCCYAERREVTT